MSRPVAVVGLGRSNRSLARYLLKHGRPVTALEQRTRAQLGADAPAVAALVDEGMVAVLGPQYLDGDLTRFETLYLTPGMRKDLAPLVAARAGGVQLSGEIPLFMERVRCPVAGITGSAGKTTTTALVGAMLREGGLAPLVGGNIGQPVIEALDGLSPRDRVVLELSSFQLELCRTSPQVALVLNLAPNHLDVHPGYDAYRDAKLTILRHQRPDDRAILGPGIEAELAAWGREAPARRLRYRAGPAFPGGGDQAWVDGDTLTVRIEGRTQPIITTGELSIPGRHNVENALAAACVAALWGVSPQAMARAIRSFRGVEHRLELVCERGGVRYVNDSIATAPDRTMAALRTTPPPIRLVAGGYDKGLDYAPLGPLIEERVVALYLAGPTAARIARCAPRTPARIFAALRPAVLAAAAEASPGDTVLLSPASASYDEFTDFEARGRAFRAWVSPG